MKKLKTSSKISLKYTLFTSIILIFFWVFINLFYFTQWYEQEKAIIDYRPSILNNMWFWMWFWRNKFKNEFIRNTQQNKSIANEIKAIEIINNRILLNISTIDNQYVLFSIIDWILVYTNVNHHLNSQKNLLITSIYIILLFIILTYILSLYFVKNSLKNLNKLLIETKKLKLNKSNKIEIDWPDDDEIKLLAESINYAMNKINIQAKSLKNFISNASHELKTPLMEILCKADKINEKEIKNDIIESVHNMNNIVESLLLLAKIQSNWDISKNECDIWNIIEKNINKISDLYKHKSINITYKNKLPGNKKIETNKDLFEIVFKNILENSFKYTNVWWNILINLNNNYYEITDDWIWIEEKDIDKILESFYQVDTSKNEINSFWLWLYIVKEIIKVLWYKLEIKSEKNKWSSFKVIFINN